MPPSVAEKPKKRLQKYRKASPLHSLPISSEIFHQISRNLTYCGKSELMVKLIQIYPLGNMNSQKSSPRFLMLRYRSWRTQTVPITPWNAPNHEPVVKSEWRPPAASVPVCFVEKSPLRRDQKSDVLISIFPLGLHSYSVKGLLHLKIIFCVVKKVFLMAVFIELQNILNRVVEERQTYCAAFNLHLYSIVALVLNNQFYSVLGPLILLFAN